MLQIRCGEVILGDEILDELGIVDTVRLENFPVEVVECERRSDMREENVLLGLR